MDQATISLLVSVCAVVVAATSLFYTQRRTDNREREKWRRESSLALTSALLQVSHHRQQDLSDYLDSYYGSLPRPRENLDSFAAVNQMGLLVEQIRLLDDGLAVAAEKVFDLHRETIRHWEPSIDPVTDLEAQIVEPELLKQAHTALVDAFRKMVALPAVQPHP